MEIRGPLMVSPISTQWWILVKGRRHLRVTSQVQRWDWRALEFWSCLMCGTFIEPPFLPLPTGVLGRCCAEKQRKAVLKWLLSISTGLALRKYSLKFSLVLLIIKILLKFPFKTWPQCAWPLWILNSLQTGPIQCHGLQFRSEKQKS